MILKIRCVSWCVEVGLLVANLKHIFTQRLELPEQTLAWLTDEYKFLRFKKKKKDKKKSQNGDWMVTFPVFSNQL